MNGQMKPSRRRLLFLLALPLLGNAVAAERQQPLKTGGLEIFYGVIPAEMILGHPSDHDERRMHGGVPSGSGQHHLIISLFDARTRARVTDATARATVTEPGLATQQKALEPMVFAGALTYGNYFRMTGPGPYRIEVEILRPGSTIPVKTTFGYSHPRR
jgi:hypothetical protein